MLSRGVIKSMIKDLRCPICQTSFQENSQGIACENRHQFDKSKDGYFNLLPVQNKNSREPGDAKEQLRARRNFLQAGLFDPLKEKILSSVKQTPETILDLGSGEGYFTRALANKFPQANIYGVDIAKAGVGMAAKAAKSFGNIIHVVASNFDLPIQDDSIDLILRILAPSKDSELQRLLKQEGRLIVVVPDEQHLVGLRNNIYKELRPLQSLPAISGFELLQTTAIQFPLDIEGAHLSSLLEMTPFSWKLDQAKKELLSGIWKDTAAFLIGEYRKR